MFDRIHYRASSEWFLSQIVILNNYQKSKMLELMRTPDKLLREELTVENNHILMGKIIVNVTAGIILNLESAGKLLVQLNELVPDFIVTTLLANTYCDELKYQDKIKCESHHYHHQAFKSIRFCLTTWRFIVRLLR